MRASLLIAAHNEGDSLWKTIRACVETIYDVSYEIVVADDASNDGSIENALRRFPQIRVVSQPERLGASPTKHAATLEAEGDVLVFLDGHTNPEFGAIKRLIQGVEELNGQAILTPAVPYLDTTNWLNSRAQVGHGYSFKLDTLSCNWLSLKELPVREMGRRQFRESPALIGCALAVSRVLYQQLHGFDRDMRFWGVEDIDFGLKSLLMGFPILHDPQAIIGHRFRQSFDNYSVPNEHVIANQLRFARKHFTSAVWAQWVEACRLRSNASLTDHPEGLWARAWQLFEERRESVEQERHYLQSRRVHDEFWYAEKFGLDWPRLATQSTAPVTSVPSERASAAASQTVVDNTSTLPAIRSMSVDASSFLSPSPSPPTDPSGGGAVGNNMVLVTSNVYDGGAAGGDGNLTQVTQFVDATTTRVTTMTYDFRNRRITTDGEIDYFEMAYYDNLDQVVKLERYDTTASGNLIGRSVTNYDDQSRIYQTIVYAVDPGTGIVGNSLTDNTWYDASGNVIKSFPAGSNLFTKASYDSLGRQTFQYAAFGPDSTYADASSVANNTVMEQAETTYDEDSNTIQKTIRQRYHNAPATQTGPLQNPGATPNARVTYVAMYPDAVGRPVSVANYGTNGGTALSRPTTAPARSDTVLVNTNAYDATGEISQTTDPAGIVNAFAYDARGRDATVTQNSGGSSSGGSSCPASDDTNVMTKFTYAPDGQQATLVAVNPRTSDQTTTYTYGTTLTESGIATSLLLRYVDYPDSTGGSDRVALTYNRLGQRTTITDQRGCVHSLLYDLLGRFTNDCVTTLGTGVDGTIRRLTAAYEVRGLTTKLTSYDNPTVGSGSIVNEVGLTYNSFGQLISDAQSHSGAVVPGTTPLVQYAYADGSSNTIRPTTLTYPNGRAITTSYGTSGGINDSITRVDGLIDGSTTLVNYAYLGLNVPVQTTYPQPSIQYTLLGSSTGTSPAGDIYWGLDQFGRIIDSRWFNTGTSADVDRIKYGYDRASNRIWRQNPVATAAGAQFDEFYTNDGLQRLKDMQRGTLNSTNTGITVPTFEQCWTLDPTGNWLGFHEATLGGWPLDQSRTANTVNEITGITNTTGGPWATPAYDAAGNMTTIPRVSAPVGPLNWATLTSTDWSNLTTDQWSSMDVGPSSSGTGAAFTATYDAWNRLVSIADASTGQTVQQNQYDARTFRTVILSYTAGVLSETRHSYFSSDWRCIEERVGTATTAERQFVWGVRYIDDLILRDRGTERLYALQDANWNVTSIVNSAGVVQERFAYTAYGTPTYLTPNFGPRPASSFSWEILFGGYRYDPNRQLYCVRFRFYDPTVGNWCQRDPIAYRAGINLYLYTSAKPIGRLDPFGLDENDEYIFTTVPKTGSTLPLRDVEKKVYGDANFKDINCIGHATGAGYSIQVNPNVSVKKILFEQGFDCEKGKSAATCVSDCKDKVCAMVYLYVKSKVKEKIDEVKRKFGKSDPFEIGIGDFGDIDIHGLKGVGVDDSGVCQYTFVMEDMPKERDKNGKYKYKVKKFIPTTTQPEFFEDQSRILGQWCCCNKFKDRDK